jgi:hypothetical protein
VSRAPQHATLPERGPSRRLPRRWLGGLADAAKETPDLLEIGQESHELHTPTAARTASTTLEPIIKPWAFMSA